MISFIIASDVPDLHPDHVSCLNGTRCWGYESDCTPDRIFKKTECPDGSNGWTNSKKEQEKTFFNQADFGYVSQIRNEMTDYCTPMDDKSSLLQCSQYSRFCRGRNVFIDLKKLNEITEPMRYRGDVLDDGMIGGSGCQLNKSLLQSHGSGHKSPLQSWFEEIEHFTVKDNVKCDVIIEKKTYLMKLDATVNMYHHFCDFINLYLSFHVNDSLKDVNMYDNNIMIWDTFKYSSNFGITWKAFTDNEIMHLGPYKGKVVCFKDIVFPLLPRMVFGMYYNMPLIPGCHASGVFKAFNQHVMHRLKVKIEDLQEVGKKIRITIIDRQTRYRNILNIDQLINALQKKNKNFVVQKVNFHHRMPFIDQMTIVANTDILIGMHGAGLTHVLFLPDHAVLFELYNCDDEHCYKDLARLRGVKYLTWEKENLVQSRDEGQHPQLNVPHKKFTDYSFDETEFVRLVMIGVKHVRSQRQKFPAATIDQRNEL